MIKAVIFDLDDTLLWDKRSVKEAFRATCALAAERCGADPDDLEEAVRRSARELYEGYDTYGFTQMIGINPFEGLWGRFQDEGEDFRQLRELVPGYRKDAWTNGLASIGKADPELGAELAEVFPEERKNHPFVYDDSFKVLDRLKGTYRLLLLTNGSPELQQTKLDLTPELVPYFDEIVVSGAFGRGKPDPAIFEHALKRMDISRHEAVMVGDNLNTDILGANQAGITSVWVNRHAAAADRIRPDHEIQSLTQLPALLEEISGNL